MAVLDWLQQLLGGGDPEAEGAAAASTAMMPAVNQWAQNVGSGQYVQQGLPSTYDPQRSFAQNALNPNSLENALNIALGVSGGGLATKPKVPGDFPAPNIGKGTEAPLFDLSRLTERPDVPQVPLERAPPPAKGVPDWAQSQVTDPARIEQYKQILQTGRNVGGDEAALGWWNTFPLRDRYIGEFGEALGDAKWRSDMNLWSATSPRSPFPTNIRQASYFGNLLAEGQPLPELVRKPQTQNPNAFNLVPAESAPSGYANFPLHIQNIENLLQPDRVTLGNAYPLNNPKPASMAQNLVGNWSVPTIDVRDLRAMGMTNKSGSALQSVDPASLYGYIEDTFHKPLATNLGLAPAQMQSSTWLGVPTFFGEADRSGLTSALGTLEDSIRRTAAARGLTPEETFVRGFLKKEFPLLSVGAGGAGMVSQGVDPDQRAAIVK